MKVTYENELRDLQNWLNDVNENQLTGKSLFIKNFSVDKIHNQIEIIAAGIACEYPFYASELRNISVRLFFNSSSGILKINRTIFGELLIIVKYIIQEPLNMNIWNNIHPRIVEISKALYSDGYYDSAAEKAVKELESRLRELFQKLKPDDTVPDKIVNVIGALLSEKGAYQFADLSTTSGKNYQRGIYSLFEGIFAAYRNPSSHGNIPCSKREAIEQIVLASQLMYVLDK